MNRRDFIRNSMLGAAGLAVAGLPLPAEAAATIRLTVLHTNDQHSRIEPFPNDGRKWGGLGGMARRASLVQKVREQEPNVLLLDSGDIWQGTPYFNFFGGEVEYKLMSQMQYDAATLGNHDFDAGLEGLARQLPLANFPFVTANYDFSNTILKDKVQPYKVFRKGDIKVGVFGLGIELAGLVSPKLSGNTIYLDPVKKAQEMVKVLREEEKCHLVICLSHLGYHYDSPKIDDRKLAQQVSGIDLILGGHTHTFMEQPETIAHYSGHHTLINQVGWAGINLGRVDFTFSKKTKERVQTTAQVLQVNETVRTS
ncbi:MAG: metallophosphoesterase [Hymenobacteraceae bacterium]|nr:metallophosphoesterase [Hymenobacteraceae bacterium]MDX5394979.1 metallophosphoesterase [Hymenobacteraceae bacterium]MDX5443221.1 metallophosphoesterase [Hymenobacteraceae bacterium]MDX5511012.1 metallophosphoesterase [Hymenobacteraceae bacterium]